MTGLPFITQAQRDEAERDLEHDEQLTRLRDRVRDLERRLEALEDARSEALG